MSVAFTQEQMALEDSLRYFSYAHLPPHLASISQGFAVLAHDVVTSTPPGPQRSLALQLLLQSKDAAVRAALQSKP